MEFKVTSGITHNELKEVLIYDIIDGVFTWRVDLGKRAKKGVKAGWFDKTTGYEYIKIKNKKYSSHRLAWFYVNKVMPNNIDHINHIKTDNRINNLRNVSHKENMQNQKLSKNNKSGFCGVNFREKQMKWVASIKINNKSIHLGIFKNKDEAINCRKTAEIKYNYHKNHGQKLIEEATKID